MLGTSPSTCTSIYRLCVPKVYRRSHTPVIHRYSQWQRIYLAKGSLTRSFKITTSIVLGAGLLITFENPVQEKLRHIVSACQRSGRVLLTLLLCINDYRKALDSHGASEVQYQDALNACHKRCAERTLRTMKQNGSIFIKLGQHLSSMDYLLPIEWTSTFTPLQDHCPVSTYESIEHMFLKDTGDTLQSIFSEFARDPVGAASLAQVHLATIRDTREKVAVKLQHPALKEWVPLDLTLTRLTFSTLRFYFPEYDLDWLYNVMETSLSQELDFSQEAAFALRTKKYFEALPRLPLLVPDVKWSSKRILVMEYLAGHRPDDLQYLDVNGIDRDEVSAALARIFNEMIFGDTLLHCDPHGGNIAIRKNKRKWGHNFDIILYDHGLYKDIPQQLRRDYARLWLAVIDSDEQRMREYSYKVAGIKDDDFPLFASLITGRDFISATKSIVSTRSEQEKELISGALGDGLLPNLVQLLSKVPRTLLLILKTNDLTRSLDENLQTSQGPVRNFMILAHYCTRTVFREEIELLKRHGGSVFHPNSVFRLMAAWLSYARIEFKIVIYEWYMSLKRSRKYTGTAQT